MATPPGVEYPARRIADVERAEPKMALEIERPLLSAVVEHTVCESELAGHATAACLGTWLMLRFLSTVTLNVKGL